MSNEWREYAIGEIAEVVGGGTPSTSDPENFDGDIPWITPKDLSTHMSRFVSRGERNISKKGLQNSSAKLLPAGAVLLTTRAPVGYIAIASNSLTTNQGFRSLVLNDQFDSQFVYYLLKANVKTLIANASGTTFGELSGSTLKKLKFKFPPYQEQRAIAHILGTLDDKIELNRRMCETLEQMARALFKSWFVDFEPVRAKMSGRWKKGQSLPGLPAHLWDLFPARLVDSELGKIPDGWEIGSIGDIATVTSGNRPDISSKNPTHTASIPLWGGNGPMGFVPRALFNEPIILTGRVGTLGSVFRISSPCWPSDNTLVIIPKDSIFYEYLYLQLKLIDFSSLDRGSTQPLLTQTDLKNQILLLPCEFVLKKFTNIAKNLYKQIDQKRNETNMLAALRDTLLPKLISG